MHVTLSLQWQKPLKVTPVTTYNINDCIEIMHTRLYKWLRVLMMIWRLNLRSVPYWRLELKEPLQPKFLNLGTFLQLKWSKVGMILWTRGFLIGSWSGRRFRSHASSAPNASQAQKWYSDENFFFLIDLVKMYSWGFWSSFWLYCVLREDIEKISNIFYI